MKERIKRYIVNYLTKNLLHAVSDTDILRITNRGYLYGKRRFTPEEIEALKNEAQALSESFLWKLMVKEVEYVAFLTMSAKAKTADDILFGKAVFYATDIMKKFLEGLKKV